MKEDTVRTDASLLECFYRPCLAATLLLLLAIPAATQAHVSAQGDNPRPPASPVKLIFIHHSTGENWLEDGHGRLGITLRGNNYFVSDTNYGWGPDSIGDKTDIGHWWTWFAGPSRDTYTSALYGENGQHSYYSRLPTDPGGPNQIILFKSCFPNSNLGGNPNDPPTSGGNPLRGQSEPLTVGNAKGIYNDILAYFATRQDKLFVVITAPPLVANGTDAASAANARAFNNWLVYDWLDGYPHHNVAVFDFYNVLTSNGGNPFTNDLASATGNHHRWRNAAIEHRQDLPDNFSAYGSDAWDSHPTAAGGRKASAEFVQLLNVFYNRFAGTLGPTPTRITASPTARPTPTGSPTRTETASPTRTSSPGAPPTRTRTPRPPTTPGELRIYLPIILKEFRLYVPPSPTPTRTATTDGCPGQTVIIQRGTRGEVADAYIWQSEPDYTGNWDTLYTGCVGWGRKQTLLRFDLSTLDAGATVHHATLQVKQKDSSGPRTVNVHRILAEWGEDAVTWSSFAERYDRSIVGSFSTGGSGWKHVDVTNLVRGWWNGTSSNCGLLLDDPSAGPDEAEEFVASEDWRVNQRPKLEICLSGE
jgi:hypothetical protein